MDQNQTIRTHRVGTLTFGSTLVLFGILFLVNIFVPQLDYEIIYHLWPCIFIFLGVEVLAGSFRGSRLEREGEKVNFVYDKTAILLTACLTFFAMIMGIVDMCLRYGDRYIHF